MTLNMTGASLAPVINNQLARARIEETSSAKLVRPKATDWLIVINATSISPADMSHEARQHKRSQVCFRLQSAEPDRPQTTPFLPDATATRSVLGYQRILL